MSVTTAGPLPDRPYDVVIVGAGVVGTAIARELARHRPLRIALVDAADDVGEGTSKANTAILHTGFDATPGSLEARLVQDGARRLADYAAETGIPLERTGALLVAWDDDQLGTLPALADKARRNGVTDVRPLSAADLYDREPRLGPGALGALSVPGESIVCPWTTPLAYATQAVLAGVDLHLRCRVRAIRDHAGQHELTCDRGLLRARYLVNAAGLEADHVDSLLGRHDFTVTPRRGQLIVYDTFARPLVRHILLPVPTARGKGVLVAPTVYGNVLLGPTAEDLSDKRATGSTAEGLALLREKGRRILPELLGEEVTAVYAGLRAATDHDDYRIRAHPEQRAVTVGGIRSTGLTASLGIAAYTVGLLEEIGLALPAARDLPPLRMPPLGRAAPRPCEQRGLVAADPAYGVLVCPCERVSQGEVRDALATPVPPTTLAGLRRRTRVLSGRCQGFTCGATVRNLLARARAGTPPTPHAPTGSRFPGTSGTAAASAPRTAPATPQPPPSRIVDALVVGAGPAGCAAAAELAAAGVPRLLVLHRDDRPGVVSRSGPQGARHADRLLDTAVDAGAVLRTGATALDWVGPRTLLVTGPQGPEHLTARTVLLATGARERPRAARLVPGTRPAGVLTGGELWQTVHRYGLPVGGRAVVVGAEPVSHAAVDTLRRAGVHVVAMVTDLPHGQGGPLHAQWHRLVAGVPLLTGASVTALHGRPRLTGLSLRHHDGRTTTLACDTVVFTGDLVPDHELARRGGLDLDPGTRGVVVDAALRTSRTGVFAAGGLLHPTDRTAVAVDEGVRAARSMLAHLAGGAPSWPAWDGDSVPVRADPPLRWVVPNRIVPGDPSGPGLLVSPSWFLTRPTLLVTQDGRLLHRERRRRTAVPNRTVRLSADWTSRVDAAGGPVRVTAG